jgi:uncharacterized membrane protein
MVFALLVTTLASTICGFVGFLALAGKLPPNHFAGIRTPFTRRNPENWYAVHQAGSPYLVLLSVAGLAAGLAFVPFALAGKLAGGLVTAIVVAQCALIVAGALLSWWIGTSKAKAQLSDSL